MQHMWTASFSTSQRTKSPCWTSRLTSQKFSSNWRTMSSEAFVMKIVKDTLILGVKNQKYVSQIRQQTLLHLSKCLHFQSNEMHYYGANFESILCWVLLFYCQNCARLTVHWSRGKQVLKTTCGSKVALLLPPSGQVWNCDGINFKCVESKSSQSLMRLSSHHHKLSYTAPNSLCLIFFL